MAQITRKSPRCKRGIVLVEMAIVLLLLLTITIGIIEYGWLFLKAQQTTNAARQGARVAIRLDSTNSNVTSTINTLMTNAGMGSSGYSVIFSPSDIAGLDAGTQVGVTIVVPTDNVALIKALVPIPDNLRASVTMVKEGS